jgi:hypothetical protein
MQAVGSEEHFSIGLVGRFNSRPIDSEIVRCQYDANIETHDEDVVAITKRDYLIVTFITRQKIG